MALAPFAIPLADAEVLTDAGRGQLLTAALIGIAVSSC